MLKRDDPRVYRHASNGNPGQCNSPLMTTADTWLKGRINIKRAGLLTVIIPEVFVIDGTETRTPETAVPEREGTWLPIINQKTGRQEKTRILSGPVPGAKTRVERAIATWKALFHARAIIPEIVEK